MTICHAPSTIVAIQGQSKKKIWVSHYSKIRQKPRNNQQKTQKLTTSYAQFFLILWKSVTKYIGAWSKSVNTFKTFEIVQHTPILMPPPSNSMLCLRYKLTEWQELSTQMQSHLHTTLKLGGTGGWSQNFCNWLEITTQKI